MSHDEIKTTTHVEEASKLLKWSKDHNDKRLGRKQERVERDVHYYAEPTVRNKPSSSSYRDGWDRIFGDKEKA